MHEFCMKMQKEFSRILNAYSKQRIFCTENFCAGRKQFQKLFLFLLQKQRNFLYFEGFSCARP